MGKTVVPVSQNRQERRICPSFFKYFSKNSSVLREIFNYMQHLKTTYEAQEKDIFLKGPIL